MKRNEFSKTGIDVSAMCLGCMYFGTKTDEKTSFQLLDQYFECGGNFLDTANNYAFWVNNGQGGESETLLGRWMKERKNRDSIFLATKVGARPTVAGSGFGMAEGLSAAAITDAVDQSLRRLDTDHIDLYYAHVDQRTTPLEETLEAFQRIIAQGKARYLGCSNMATWRIERARSISRFNRWEPYRCVQQWHSYLRPRHGTGGIDVPEAGFAYQTTATDELLEYARVHEDFSIVAYSSLMLGAYSRPDRLLPEKYEGADTDERLRVLQQVAKEIRCTTNQLVLAWMLGSQSRIFPIIAASTTDQLRENLAALNLALTEGQISTLTNAHA
jgi:aryl-alcohol dehydrogenase-like predicted oxidoreductase